MRAHQEHLEAYFGVPGMGAVLHTLNTGDPKGVVYSHRSTYLHATAVMAASVHGYRAERVNR
jgi:acyl-CoA synthetase (AMP-forming)/AMP-acid ligase II